MVQREKGKQRLNPIRRMGIPGPCAQLFCLVPISDSGQTGLCAPLDIRESIWKSPDNKEDRGGQHCLSLVVGVRSWLVSPCPLAQTSLYGYSGTVLCYLEGEARLSAGPAEVWPVINLSSMAHSQKSTYTSNGVSCLPILLIDKLHGWFHSLLPTSCSGSI
jgi:hypothetical protein